MSQKPQKMHFADWLMLLLAATIMVTIYSLTEPKQIKQNGDNTTTTEVSK